jgi:holo-[acyl-carrier protein] synthase
MEIGIDIEEIQRIETAHKKWGFRFLNKIFTQSEIDYCLKKKNPYPSMCGRFCAKEAIIKVLDAKVTFSDIEIVNTKTGKPLVFLNKKQSSIKISISHSRKYATAVAIKL